MTTDYFDVPLGSDPQDGEAPDIAEEDNFTICPNCGADLQWHVCPPREE